MAEAREIKQARERVRQRENTWVQGQVNAGRQSREVAAAAGQEQSAEQRQNAQQAATQRVAAQRDHAAAQGQGA